MESIAEDKSDTRGVAAALRDALDTLEDLEKLGHVKSHAHMLLAKKLQAVHIAEDVEISSAVEDIMIHACVDDAQMLSMFGAMPSALLRGVTVYHERFISRLLLARSQHGTALDSARWFTELFRFYFAPKDSKLTAAVYSMHIKCRILCIAKCVTTPVLDQLFLHLRREGPSIDAVCPYELDDDYVDEDGDTVAGNISWMHLVGIYAPGLLQPWIAQRSVECRVVF